MCVLLCVRVVCCDKKTGVCYANKYLPLLPVPPLRPLLVLRVSSFVFRPSCVAHFSQVLTEAGADGTIKNGEGFAADVGIEGKIDAGKIDAGFKVVPSQSGKGSAWQRPSKIQRC